ncbi:hypothetical protein HMPREF0577_1977 [Mobiluncus mulieris ATCC 35243]|nr:hypothetical protein HMPREF0577_1977 [Mobiluncus mulieris ATCC 35243]
MFRVFGCDRYVSNLWSQAVRFDRVLRVRGRNRCVFGNIVAIYEDVARIAPFVL